MQKDFITFLDWSAGELSDLVEAAQTFRQLWVRGESPPALKGRRIALMWGATGFRNRVAFELGIAELGGKSVEIPGTIDVNEPLEDVARYLDNWFDAVVARTATHDQMLRLARSVRVPVINARTPFNHPCEILGDLAYVKEQRGDLTDLRVAFVGEATNLGHSWFEAAARFPIHVVQVCPPGYEVEAQFLQRIAREAKGEVSVSQDMHSAVADADVIYTDCWPARGTAEDHQTVRDLFLPYQVTEEILRVGPEDALFLPCPPIHRGEEVSAGAMNWPGCRVYEAKEYLLHAQSALLVSLLNAGGEGVQEWLR